MKTLYCFLKGHSFEIIKKVSLTMRPLKLVKDANGNPIVSDRYYGVIDYLKENDYSKPEQIVGTRITSQCKKCGKILVKEI